MSAGIEVKLRGPDAYILARKALSAMEQHQIWPTAVNFELWTHCVGDPDGDLAREITRIISTGEAFTDTLSDELAAVYLPKARLNEQIRDAGDALTKELANVSQAIETAQKSSVAYGQTLATASKSLSERDDATEVKSMIDTLAVATKRVQKENKSLEKRLSDSTAEVARLREHLEQVRRDATTDGLTNLANRKAFDEELERACAEADAKGETLALAVIDIDHFKNFNDTWGHQTGDQVIRYVASVIGGRGAPPRFAARYGGEEFALIFPREGGDIAIATLEEIREEVSSRMLKRRSTNEDLGTITVSAGLAERMPHESAHNFMERADRALYASKRSGRNRVSRAETIAAAA
ncbi:MAG: GGDEF domain-containing protein [Phenylobacterium sp.]|uniref:GGDEF domain-containing protein n=1 Tax=Phenylobacterium sp. TaxID=1871053 RepID=UPI002727CE44|nr:GGDEF domain-containing protein [Phenylobacterium sp.]MDO8913066.1 GGDEF domain-containing protein [Phenylobacterium sp.]MDO9246874.1 GGDEF domain-containing protein [Phenylobacterium sp.]MDP2010438.1 GGDEF domain-containing protein [Phenylobacterium sp.]MDP3101024.1 GGDEF domain-containing protein [Phenylobacterium sp.]MDP3632811.1 GGDEF domain-containing protein [Phenylobacterium sp.]